MEVEPDELFEERLVQAEERLATQTNTLNDLLEYLRRTDANFHPATGTFDNWRTRLESLRQEERVQREVAHAKQCLANHGYLVVRDESELDAARVKKWVQTGKDPDDDIPF